MQSRESQRPRGTRRFVGAMRHVIVLCAVLLTQACNDLFGPNPGTLTGTVVLQDAWANRLGDFSGVEVSVDGLSKSAITDAAGKWEIDGVPSGRHDITFKKATFGTARVVGQNTSGRSTTMPNVTLGLTPWQQAIIDSVRTQVLPQTGKDYYFVVGHLSSPPPPDAKFVTAVVFLGKTAAVSTDTASFNQWNTFTDGTGKASSFLVVFSGDTVRAAFGTGGQAFAAAYVSASACTCYPDQPTTKPLFSSIGPRANVVQLTIK